MNVSFYTASVGASTQQEKMDVVANNLSNVNTPGYKAKSVSFQELYYGNMRAIGGDPTNTFAGTGVKNSHTNTDFTEGALMAVGGDYNYAINGEGFFMIQDPNSEEISYTRNGNFYLSLREGGVFHLSTQAGKLVLDNARTPITLTEGQLTGLPGMYTFTSTDGMLNVGNSEFVPVEKNGEPILNQEARLQEGMLENSNVDTAKEMANTVETSRAYSYILKMLQTTDEVHQTINGLRG